LLIREDSRNDQGVTSSSTVNQNHDTHYKQLEGLILTVKRESVCVNSTQSDSKVRDTSKDDWSQDTNWQLCDNFTEEVGTHRIHVIVHFS
jgi:hypothetical protein